MPVHSAGAMPAKRSILPMFPAQNWIKMKPSEIPTGKGGLHPLFRRNITKEATTRCARILDLGCGDGRIALETELTEALNTKGTMEIVGVDCNVAAIQVAKERASRSRTPGGSRAKFVVGDITSVDLTDSEELFDIVLCQMVVSIVGGVTQRKALLAVCLRHLKPNGKVLISASGASEDVNPQYKQIYYQDLAATEEYRTYLRRDMDGKVLYLKHHFEANELADLLREAGFIDVEIVLEVEGNDTRPNHRANFLYVTATAPGREAGRPASFIPRSRENSSQESLKLIDE